MCGCTPRRRALPLRPFVDALLHGPRAHARRRGGRRTARARPARASSARTASQSLQRRERLLADGHDARFRALAEHAHRAVGRVDVAQIEPDELREPQARRVEQLEDRAVAQRHGIVAADREQARDLIGVERRGQTARRLRRLHVHAGVALQHAHLDEVVQERAHGRQAPRDAARAEAPAMAFGGEPAHRRTNRAP